MNAFEFADLFLMLEKKLNLHFDSNLVKYIYDEYCKTYYEKYTLFELIDILDYKHIPIDCKLNKKELIEMIKEKRLDIPDKGVYDEYSKTSWFTYTTCNNNQYYKHAKQIVMTFQPQKNVICIRKMKTDIELSQNDVFEIDGIMYEIFDILKDKIIIYHSNSNTTENIPINDFMQLIDTNNATMVKNNLRYDLQHFGFARYIMY